MNIMYYNKLMEKMRKKNSLVSIGCCESVYRLEI